jgi:hypothetical protein
MDEITAQVAKIVEKANEVLPKGYGCVVLVFNAKEIEPLRFASDIPPEDLPHLLRNAADHIEENLDGGIIQYNIKEKQ